MLCEEKRAQNQHFVSGKVEDAGLVKETARRGQ